MVSLINSSFCSLEVVLKDARDPSRPIEVARKELPYSFDVRSSKPRIKQPTGDQNVRRGARHLGPAAIPSPPATSQLAMELEEIKHMAGEFPDRERAELRTRGHVSSISESEQQEISELQCLPFAIPVPNPALLVREVRPQHDSPGGEDRDSPEGCQGLVIATRSGGSSLRINPPPTPSTSNAGAQDISGNRGQPYNTPNIQSPLFSHVPLSALSFPRIPTSPEAQIRVKVAERDVQINALETTIKNLEGTLEADGREKDAALRPLIEYLYSQILAIQKEIADRLNAFSAERQKAEAVVSTEIADLEAQINILKEENFRDASILTTISNTTK